MVPEIIVFQDKPATKKQEQVLQTFDQHTKVLVDSVHGKDKEFLQKNYKGNYRFFFISEFLSSCTIEDMDYMPDFAVTFSDYDTVTERDWICISRYIETWFFPHFTPDEAVIEQGKKLLEPLNHEAELTYGSSKIVFWVP